MKKIKTVLAVVLAFVTLLTLVSCTTGGTNASSAASAVTETESEKAYRIFNAATEALKNTPAYDTSIVTTLGLMGMDNPLIIYRDYQYKDSGEAIEYYYTENMWDALISYEYYSDGNHVKIDAFGNLTEELVAYNDMKALVADSTAAIANAQLSQESFDAADVKLENGIYTVTFTYEEVAGETAGTAKPLVEYYSMFGYNEETSKDILWKASVITVKYTEAGMLTSFVMDTGVTYKNYNEELAADEDKGMDMIVEFTVNKTGDEVSVTKYTPAE